MGKVPIYRDLTEQIVYIRKRLPPEGGGMRVKYSSLFLELYYHRGKTQ
jgi:hypothetical protein